MIRLLNLLTGLTLITLSSYAQPKWTEQPVFFSVGFAIGWNLDYASNPYKLGLTMAIGKTAYDLGTGKTPDPSAIAIGSWMGSSLQLERKRSRSSLNSRRSR